MRFREPDLLSALKVPPWPSGFMKSPPVSDTRNFPSSVTEGNIPWTKK